MKKRNKPVRPRRKEREKNVRSEREKAKEDKESDGRKEYIVEY